MASTQKWDTCFRICLGLANDLWAHPQQHHRLAVHQSTSTCSRHEIIRTRVLQPPLPTPSAGRPRILNINKIVYIKSWGILIMLAFRGAIHVALFSVLAIVNNRSVDFIGNRPQTSVPGVHGQRTRAGQRPMQTKPTTDWAI